MTPTTTHRLTLDETKTEAKLRGKVMSWNDHGGRWFIVWPNGSVVQTGIWTPAKSQGLTG